jgi:glucose-1-phosphate cytidylyltransferase
MKVVILAGGLGTRISEESVFKPKPMIEIGEHPILWHIMKSYSYYGFNEFIICAGYKANVIKEYFADYYLYHSDITFDFRNGNNITIHNNFAEPWKVTVVDTGLNTMTGGRLKRIEKYIGGEPFMLTYGDGVCDINIRKLYEYHLAHDKMITLTAIQPGSRFGTLEINSNNLVEAFAEKKVDDGGWINGGYMVINPEFLSCCEFNDSTVLEREPMETAVALGSLAAYKYNGFWQCMDTLRDKQYLERLLETGKAPWTVWEE